MQPLISPIVSDQHESRHNSYRGEDEQRPSESSPLLHRFPRTEARLPRDRVTSVVVSLLLLMLISGVIIGIYLLIVQNESENVLPPVESPLRLVSEAQWNPSWRRAAEGGAPFLARRVLVVQTDTRPCFETRSCARLLAEHQNNASHPLPYNFLVSSNGLTFEALGWRRPSPMFPEYSTALVLAFIGNFTDVSPTRTQVDEARNFFAESVSLRRLVPAYVIVGKTQQYTPKRLFEVFSQLPQWSNTLSDS